jgi:hypothetical protein
MSPEDLTLDYRAALLRYLPRREEAARAAGYEIGRQAVAAGTSLLELARIHHEVMVLVMEETDASEVHEVARRAGEFFLEVLAPYDMTQRGLLEGR